MSESIAAINADIVWRTNTREATVDVEKLRREFHESTGQMSTDALRLASAQDRLDKALVRHGASSRQARDAEIALRRATTESTVAAERHSAALNREQREIGQLGRGAIVGSGAVRGLARSAAFASTTFLGSAGLVYGLRLAKDTASNLNEQTTKAEQIFGSSTGTIERWGKTTATSIGIANDQALEAAGTFGNLFTVVGLLPDRNARLSRSLVQLGADLASFNNADPTQVLQDLRSGVVGEAEPLRKYGILLSETRVQQEALIETGKKRKSDLTDQEKLLARVTLIFRDSQKAQGDYARTSEGVANSERTVKAEFRDTLALIGRSLLPAYGDLLHNVRDFLGDSKNQARIQRDVNEVVRVGGQAAHGLAEGLDDIRSVAKPVVDGLGGVENTAKLMIEAFALYKLAKIVGAVRGIGLAARFSRREITTLNETPVLPKGVPGGGAGGGVGGAVRGGALGAAAATLLSTPALIEAAVLLTAGGAQGGGGPNDPLLGKHAGSKYPELDKLGRSNREMTPGEQYIYGLYRRGLLTPEQAERALRNLHRTSFPGGPPTSEDIALRGAGSRTSTSPGGSGGGGGGPGRRHGFDLPYSLQLEAARAAAGQGSELTAAQVALRYVKAQLASGRLNKKGVLDALAEEGQLQDQIDAILEQRRKKQDARDKRRRDAERRHREKLKRERETYLGELLKDAQFIREGAGHKGIYNLADLERDAKSGKTGAGSSVDFFSEAAANFRAYGSNVGDVLSGQDARGLLARIALTLERSERHQKTTATHTGKIFTGGNPAKVAAQLADVGAWTQ